MARTLADGDTHMEDVVDQGVGMEESGHGSLSRPSLTETYHSGTLLAPNADFMTDDHSSAGGGDVGDRLTYLEERMQMQEEEIQLLKMTLADVLKRLNISEEHQATGRKPPPGVKAARPVSLALPSKPSAGNPGAASLKKSTMLPPAPTVKNYATSPTSTKSAVKSPTGSVKDAPCSSKTTRARPASAAPTCKKHHESGSKAKEPEVSVGSRRVTHCKVTMQICLSPLTRRTGSSEAVKSAPAVPNARTAGAPATPQAKGGASSDRARLENCKTTPAFTLPIKKTTTHFQMDTVNHKSPIKSPSQYFQICY